MESVTQDLKFGFRSLIRRPGLTGSIVLTLALGIGGTTAVFTLLQGVLLQPLDYFEPERLVRVFGDRNGRQSSMSGPEYEQLRDFGSTFEEVAAASMTSANLTGDGPPERVSKSFVTVNTMAMLGVRPLLGRFFLDEEGGSGRDDVVLISEGLWRRRFGADPQITETSLQVDGETLRIVGVLPASFSYPRKNVALWRPMVFEGDFLTEPGSHFLQVLGRAKPGTTLAAIIDDAQAVQEHAQETWVDLDHSAHPMTAVPYAETLTAAAKPGLLLLQGAIAAVLLICCVNIANLLLVAGQRRRKELIVRQALGAGRRRLVRQLLVESLLLAIAGGGLGLLMTPWALDILVALSPGLPRLETISVNSSVLAFTALVTLGAGVLFGLFPAYRVTRPDLRGSLAQEATGTRRKEKERAVLVVVEVALCVGLLVGAGLLARSFWSVLDVDPGFDTSHTVSMSLALPDARYPENEDLTGFVRRAVEQVEAIPQVESAAITTLLPLDGSTARLGLRLLDTGTPEEEQKSSVIWRAVSPGIFSTLGIPLLRGRGLSDADFRADAPAVVIINQAMAQRHWPEENPLGKRIELGYNDIQCEIVGVVGDLRHASLDAEAMEEVYTPFSHTPWTNLSIVTRLRARDASQTEATFAALRDAVWKVDPDQPVYAMRFLEELVAGSLAQRRSLLLLLGAFAAMSLVLAAVGIYGVVSSSVAQRTREVGIRKALGANVGDLLSLLFSGGLRPVIVGIALGLIGVALGHRVMTTQLFGIQGIDPLTYLVTAALVTGVAAAAIYIPARRAAATDALVALRYE